MAATLVENFKSSVKLVSIGGIAIPGAENIFRFKKIVKIFFSINYYMSVGLVNFQVGQQAYNLIYNDNLPMALKAFLSVSLITVETSALRLMAIKWKRREMEKMIKLYNVSFKEPLFPDYREEEFKAVRSRIEKIAKRQIKLFLIPLILWTLTPIVTGKELVTSAFPGDHDASPVFGLILVYHFIFAFFGTIGWVAFDTFLVLILGTILVELGHLKKSLKEIFAAVQMDQKGEIFYMNEENQRSSPHYGINKILNEKHKNLKVKAEETRGYDSTIFNEKLNQVRKLLKIWIDHYSELINYTSAVRKFYAPILLGQFFYLAVYGCATIYLALVVDLELQNIAASFVYYGNGYFMTYLICLFGNQIHDELNCSTITEEVFGQDWVLYPEDIKRSLLMITTITTKRPIEIHAFHVLKLNVKVFEKLLQLTYSFFAFMAQMQGKFKIQ